MAENTLLEKVLSLQDKYKKLEESLADPAVIADMKKFVQLNKDYKELQPIIQAGLEYKRMLDELAQAKDILMNEKDEDLREMARDEVAEIEPKLPDMEQNIKLLLIPADPDDSKNAMVEIRGGTGVTRRPSSRATCSGCTSTSPSAGAGSWRSPTRLPARPAASSRSYSSSPPVRTACTA